MTEKFRSKSKTRSKTRFGYIELVSIALAVLGLLFLFNNTAVSYNNNKYSSSLEGIEWGMSPGEVLATIDDYSTSTKIVQNQTGTIIAQLQRITESELAAKSEVEYYFKDDRLYHIKIKKVIKYWPKYILEELLQKTVSTYNVTPAYDTILSGKIYKKENSAEHKAIYLAFDDSNKPVYAHVELTSRIYIFICCVPVNPPLY